MKQLITIPRNQINAKHRLISTIWPGASLSGHFIGGKTVSNRAWLIAPYGASKSTLANIMRAAGLIPAA